MHHRRRGNETCADHDDDDEVKQYLGRGDMELGCRHLTEFQTAPKVNLCRIPAQQRGGRL
jgi:hypothetical protein